MEPGAGAVRHLYVHIPFCRARCAYCDFASEALVPRALETVTASYLNALETELAWSAPWRAQHLETVYVGGGTPTHLPFGALVALVRGLSGEGTATDGGPQSTGGSSTGGLAAGGPVAAIGPAAAAAAGPGRGCANAPRSWCGAGALELTVEAEPRKARTATSFSSCAMGMTRLSLGVQSFDASLRRTLGRSVHDEALRRVCGAVAECGLSNWNLDLIFGIPGQTWRQAEGDVLRAVAAGPAHISLYDLTYTPSYAARVARRLGLGPSAPKLSPNGVTRKWWRSLEQGGYSATRCPTSLGLVTSAGTTWRTGGGGTIWGVGAAAVSPPWVGLRWGNVSTAEEYVARWARYKAERQRGDKATWGSPSASTSALFFIIPASQPHPRSHPPRARWRG